MPRTATSALLVNGMTVEQLLEHSHRRFGAFRMDVDPQRPDDVSQEEWDALSDPGKRALDRVRRARDTAIVERQTAAQERDAAKTLAEQRKTELEQAKKTPPPNAPPPDVATQIQQAVDAAVQKVSETYTEQLNGVRAEQAAERLLTRAQMLAADALVDPTLVGTFVDLSKMTDGQGNLNEQALKDNLATLVEQRPYLKRVDVTPPPGGNPFGGHPGGARPPADKATFDARVAQQLALARQSGLAVRSDPPPPAST